MEHISVYESFENPSTTALLTFVSSDKRFAKDLALSLATVAYDVSPYDRGADREDN